MSLISLRDETTRNFDIGFFQIKKDVSVTPEDSVVYEFFSGNPVTPDAPELLGAFFLSVIPTAMKYEHGQFLNLSPIAVKGASYNRAIAGVATWPSAADFYQFTNTTVFRDGIEKYLNPALAEQEIINTHYLPD